MKNVYTRDLSAEFIFLNAFLGVVQCDIDNTQWQIKMYLPDGMSCETAELSAISDYIQQHPISLDGKSFPVQIGDANLNVEIVKSLYTTINYNPFKPFVLVRLFEFVMKPEMEKSCELRAIVSIAGNVKVPRFSDYFANGTVPDDRICCSVNSPDYGCRLNGVNFTFDNRKFLVYDHRQVCGDAKQNLFVVEALDPIDYNKFKMAVRRILVVIGFITGDYCFGPFWVFNATTHDFIGYSDSMCKGGAAKYHMFSLNPYEYYSEADKSPDIGKAIEGQLKPITRNQMEKLLSMLDDPEFSHLFFVFQDLILNVSSVMAETKLPIYATCLEMCRNWWKDHYKDDLKKEKTSLYTEAERTDIYNKIVEILDKHYAGNPDTCICRKKIRNIFQAANQDMLTEAFKDIGIELSEEETNSFGLRNLILHGRNVVQTEFDEKNSSTYVEEIESRCFLYHALVWRFIMKVIGYEGMYIDVATRNKLFRTQGSNNAQPLIKKV